MKKVFLICLVSLTAAIAGAAKPANAEVKFCNNNSSETSVAIAYRSADGWISEGWFLVRSGRCTLVHSSPVTSPFYIHAHTPRDQKTFIEWGKDKTFAVSRKKFTFQNAATVVPADEREVFSYLGDGSDGNTNFTYTVDNSTISRTKASQ
jgi:uncharacterized membrane protein